MPNYLVATIKDWNIRAFRQYTPALPGQWHLISQPEDLTESLLDSLQPELIFFPHWSWKVPVAITRRVPCICFHMTDLPFGRGGSPLQNLILRGHTETRLTALQMTEQLDAGPVYAKVALSLAGSARQIFERAAPLVYQLIQQILYQQPTPQPQQGKVVYFQRRTPAQSQLPLHGDSKSLYDFIRMLDADGYPAAYIEHGNWRLEFSQAIHDSNGELTATVRFIPVAPCSGDNP